MATPPFQPSSEQALVGWVKSVPGVDATKVATSLPGKIELWAETGFIVVSAIGGATNRYVPLRAPALSLAFHGVRPGSEKSPWGKTQALAETVWNAFYDAARFPLRVEIPNFLPVSIRTGFPLTEPRKIPGSAAGYAQVQFDCQLVWAVGAP